MLIVFWTDILLWFLVTLALFFIIRLSQREDVKPILLKLTSSKVFVVSFMVVILFLIIGLLDSIHFKSLGGYQVGTEANNLVIKSYLDHLFGERFNTSEVTFSAPFSEHLYQKDKVIRPDGSIAFDYPVLSYITKVSNRKIMSDTGLIVIFSMLFTGLLLYKPIMNPKNSGSTRKRSSLLFYSFIFFSMLSIVLIFYDLSQYFHIMGTDKIGRDVFYMTVKSIRTGLVIGSVTIAIMAVLAVSLGTLAGYYGGWVDDVIQYIYTTLTSVPSILLIAASVLIIQAQMALNPDWFVTIEEQADVKLISLCVIIGLTSWSGLCRLVRAETLKIKELNYVLAAKAMKVSTFRIIIRHIIPNLGHILILSLVLDFSGMILAEAVLSYIGVGVDATTMSWGNMINAARSELSRDPIIWWNITAAFIPMFTFVLSLNLLADKLREALDPRINVE